MSRYWYSFKSTAGLDPYDEANYVRLTTTKPGCITGSAICAVYAPAGNAVPSNFSTNIENYITQALVSPRSPQPSSGKYYVYLKQP